MSSAQPVHLQAHLCTEGLCLGRQHVGIVVEKSVRQLAGQLGPPLLPSKRCQGPTRLALGVLSAAEALGGISQAGDRGIDGCRGVPGEGVGRTRLALV